MCATCGCGETDTRISAIHAHTHEHPEGHDTAHEHHEPDGHFHRRPGEVSVQTGAVGLIGREGPGSGQERRMLTLQVSILAKNDSLAAATRQWLLEHEITALNLMSSPGSGKTTLLVRTLQDLGPGARVAVIEGDQETALDADRIHATGAPVVQVNTGAGCHLDAEMMGSALAQLSVRDGSLVFVENVGNLVCPAMFDLGEAAKVVVISVTEGADKPLKYPQMFAGADLLVINKCDLLPYVDFDVAACIAYARQVNPDLAAIVVSATTGEGLPDWYRWLNAAQVHSSVSTARA